uniref:Fibronectin type-III domain-containing protein n=1 Tax=Macrostomum lignano TaxID=282301 RepID=A0A1I8GAR3_9PLAT
VACNSAADPAPPCGPASPPGIGRTPEAPPIGVKAPQIFSVTANAVHLSWLPPAIQNGVITRYMLKQNEVPLFTNLPADTNTTAVVGLMPFAQYAFRLAACTSSGCTDSPVTTVRTSEAAPADLEAPIPTTLDSSRIAIEWQPPKRPNGVVTSYRLLRNSQKFTEVSSTTL